MNIHLNYIRSIAFVFSILLIFVTDTQISHASDQNGEEIYQFLLSASSG